MAASLALVRSPALAAELPRPIRNAPEFLYDPIEGARPLSLERAAVMLDEARLDARAVPSEAQGPRGDRLAGPGLAFQAAISPAKAKRRVELQLGEGASELELTAGDQGVGFWIKAPAQTCVDWRFRDAAGRNYVVPAFRKSEDGWQYAAAMCDDFREGPVDAAPPAKDDGTGGGGRGGGSRIEFPVRFVGVSLHAGKQQDPLQADVEVRGVAAVQRRAIDKKSIHAELSDGRFANVYAPGATARGTARADSGRIEWAMTRHDGAKVAEGAGDGTVALELPLATPGHYDVLIRNVIDGRVVDARELKLAAIEPTDQVADRLGICAHFNREYYGLEGADLLPFLGINAVRTDSNWAQYEVKPGQLRVPKPVEAYLKLSKERGNRLLFLINGIGKAHGFMVPQKPDEYEKFVAFANFVLDKGAGVIDRSEIWNEWSHGTGMPADFKPTPEGYVALVNGIMPGIRKHLAETGNKVQLIGIGGENPYEYGKQVRAMLPTGVGKHFDMLSYHPYTNPHGPDQMGSEKDRRPLDEVLADLSETDRKAGGGGRLMISEAGYSTHTLQWGVSEREQARQNVRLAAVSLATPGFDRVYMYCLREEHELEVPARFRTTDQFPQHHFGMFSDKAQGYAPKQTAVSYATLARMLVGSDKLTFERPAKGVYRVAINDAAGKPMRSMWWCDAGTTARVEQGASARDLCGMSIDAKSITLSPDPVYVEGAGGRLAGS